MFFFEKKNQKTFVPWRTGPGERSCQRTKVFCFFSSEKKIFLPLRHECVAAAGFSAFAESYQRL
jgi:hypothetical protein